MACRKAQRRSYTFRTSLHSQFPRACRSIATLPLVARPPDCIHDIRLTRTQESLTRIYKQDKDKGRGRSSSSTQTRYHYSAADTQAVSTADQDALKSNDPTDQTLQILPASPPTFPVLPSLPPLTTNTITTTTDHKARPEPNVPQQRTRAPRPPISALGASPLALAVPPLQPRLPTRHHAPLPRRRPFLLLRHDDRQTPA